MSSYRKNINPRSWGPPAWSFLDSVVAGYPKAAKPSEGLAAANLMYALRETLPCKRCRRNFKRYIETYPPEEYVSGRKDLGLWLEALKVSVKSDP